MTLDRLGRELRRLTLVRLLATAPNFLLLDEPTNDLDLDTIRELEDYLTDFNGLILLVSHDRAMLDRLTDRLLVFDGAGGIHRFTGSYEDYKETETVEVRRREAVPAAAPAEDRALFKERKEYEQLLARIEALEKEQKSLESFFQEPSADPVELERNSRRYRGYLRGRWKRSWPGGGRAGRASRGLSASASPLRHAPFEVSVSRSGNVLRVSGLPWGTCGPSGRDWNVRAARQPR